MLAIPPFGASSNIALWRANIKPPVELVVDDLDIHSLANIAPIIQIMILFKSKTLNETVAAVSFYVARNFFITLSISPYPKIILFSKYTTTYLQKY